jgi:hypothetical protein
VGTSTSSQHHLGVASGAAAAPPPPPSGPSPDVVALADRVRELEAKRGEGKSRWYNSELFSAVLSGVILAAFGYALTGRLEQSSKERELNTTNATEMQALLVKISTGDANESDAAAMSLATFGRYAIPPLVANLQEGQRALAAEHGLVTLALTDSTAVCDQLGSALDNRTGRYTASSQQVIIRILGVIPCGAKQLPPLQRYADLLKNANADSAGFVAYQEAVRDATPANVTTSRMELARTFKNLRVSYAF